MGVTIAVGWEVSEADAKSVYTYFSGQCILDQTHYLPHDLLFFHVEFKEFVYMPPRNDQCVAGSERVRVKDSHRDFGGHQLLIGRA